MDYAKLVNRLLSWVEQEQLPLDEGVGTDVRLVRRFNRPYFLGHSPRVSEKSLCCLMHRVAHLSRTGRGALPRTLRVRAGAQKKCPSRSRSPKPWALRRELEAGRRWRTYRSLAPFEKAGRPRTAARRRSAALRDRSSRSVDLEEALTLGQGDRPLEWSVQ